MALSDGKCYHLAMQLEPNTCHIWTINLDASPFSFESLSSFLDSKERARAARFHFTMHQQRFVIAHGILRYVLSQYLNCPPEQIEFTFNNHQKPTLKTDEFAFNLSHSQHMAAIAIAHTTLGIDIEQMDKPGNLALAKRFFHCDEYHYLSTLPPNQQQQAFYTVWTRKEALSKAIGRGLGISLNSFNVNVVNNIEFEGQLWRLISLNLAAGFQAALACEMQIKQLSCWHFSGQTPQLDKTMTF